MAVFLQTEGEKKMPHFVLPDCQENARRSRACFLLAAAAAVGLLGSMQPLDAAAQEPGGGAAQAAADGQDNAPAAEKNKIVKISGQQTGKNLEITIYCSRYPSYDDYKLPGKIVLDLAEAETESAAELSASLLAFKTDVKATAKERSLLLEFSLTDAEMQHTVARQGNNIVLTLANFFEEEQAAAPAASGAAAPLSIPAPAPPPPQNAAKQAAAPVSSSIEAHLPANPLKPVGAAVSKPAAAAAGDAPAANMPFGGSAGELITVDFYKVDLHNVFRLLGEISGYNIIVAEGVSGTLTLALHEVPWDFVLDIVLNLKDLAKEQRHNTIVIYPKDKEFVWPQRSSAETSLSIEPEGAAKKSGGPLVVIGKGSGDGQAAPPEAAEAKKFAALGIRAEKEGSLETAVQLYEKALDLWPDKVERQERSKLANKIASIYLVRLNQNAKAVYYAKKALAADKKNSSAALNAAIGHANMEENPQAQQYFDQSISGGKPSREALFSYAVFSERQGQLEAALRLLGKYGELHGEDLDSMVSRGRILDQQGRKTEADQVYTAILHAGFSVPPDLRTFIVNRTRSN